MKKYFLFLCFLSLSLCSFAASDVAQVIQDLAQYNQTTSADSDKLGILKKLCGDTISFKFPNRYSHLVNFTKAYPDTIWKKKRPKKNPVEGKHYTLSFTYKGELVGKNYVTPRYEINGKKFGVLSIDSRNLGSNYNPKIDYIFKLIDLDDLSIVECVIPNNALYDVAISSNKVNRLIDSLKDKTVYINNGTSFSPKYIPATLNGGSYKLLFQYSSYVKELKSILDLEFVSDTGERVPITLNKSDSSSSYAKKIISEGEYNSNFVPRTLTSDVDSVVINSHIEMPFNFTYIIGVPKKSYACMSQTIDPSEVSSYIWAKNSERSPNVAMFVAGTDIVKGVKFYKMVYNGKAFFMKANDVELDSEDLVKLDSLSNSTDQVKNYFLHHTLVLSNAIYIKQLNDAISELDSYKKYGLAINSWGVYDESKYTDGTGVNVTFYNPTQQIIKYISISFQGYNAVDDPYERSISKRCIGPIEPGETATYQFEYVWFTDIVQYAKLRSITVTYKNGTTKTISNPNSIVFSDKLKTMVNQRNPVEDFN